MTRISEHKMRVATAAADEYFNTLVSLVDGTSKDEIEYLQHLTIGVALALLPDDDKKTLTPDENLQIVEHIVKEIQDYQFKMGNK